jgi:hypothetical protein
MRHGGKAGSEARRDAGAKADDDGRGDGDEGGDRCQRQRILHIAEIARRKEAIGPALMAMSKGPSGIKQSRWRRAPCRQRRRRAARQPRQRMPLHGLEARAGGKAFGRAALGAFKQREGQRHDQQAQRQLRGGHAVAHREPGRVDAGGEGLHAEMRHRSEIGDGLHQRQETPPAMAGRAIGRLTRQKADQGV